MPDAPAVRLTPDLVGSAAMALARAFADDPMWAYLYPDAGVRARAEPAVMRATMHDTLPFGETYASLVDGVPASVACWLPPGGYPQSAWRVLRFALGAARGAPLHGARLVPKLRRLMTAVDRAHTNDAHWYLSLLGTDPARQGHGHAASVLHPALARCDEEGIPAYLETTKEQNLAWYGRHGFELVEELRPIDGCPPIWTMRREPRATP